MESEQLKVVDRIVWQLESAHDSVDTVPHDVNSDQVVHWKSEKPINVYGTKVWLQCVPSDFSVEDPLYQKPVQPAAHYSIQLLLSAIQKAVRRKETEQAFCAARLLLSQNRRNLAGILALARRLPIIICEDAFYHPNIPHCVWLMMALSFQSFRQFLQPSPLLPNHNNIGPELLKHFELMLVRMVCECCQSSIVDARPSTVAPSALFCCADHKIDIQNDENLRDHFKHRNNRDRKTQKQCLLAKLTSIFIDAKMEKDALPDTHDFENDQPFRLKNICRGAAMAYIFRHAFGGMLGDMAMLHDSVHRWLERINENSIQTWCKAIEEQNKALTQQWSSKKNFYFAVAPEAVDFHVYRESYMVMVQEEANRQGIDLTVGQDEAQRLVWAHRSSLYHKDKAFLCPCCVSGPHCSVSANQLQKPVRDETQKMWDQLNTVFGIVSTNVSRNPHHYASKVNHFRKSNTKKRKAINQADDVRNQKTLDQFFKQKRK